MNLWIDADGFPRRQREIAVNAAVRKGMEVMIVADRTIQSGDFPDVHSVTVASGDDSSDGYIEAHIAQGDMVLTRDIPAMERFILKGAFCVDHQGNVYTRENIRERLSLRDFMDEYREILGKQPRSKHSPKKEVQGFAQTLAALLQ